MNKVFVAKYDSETNNLIRVWSKRLPPNCTQGDCVSSLAIGNPDGDGSKDILTSAFGGNAYLIEHIVEDSFAISWADSLSVAGRVATGDVDGNGIEEFFVGGNQPEADGVHMRIYAYERTGNNIYEPVFSFNIYPVAYFSPDRYYAIDLDRDGRKELLIYNRAWNVVLRGNGTHSYSLFFFTSVGSPDGFSAGDITGDGVPELFMSKFLGTEPGPYFWTDVFQIDTTLTTVRSWKQTVPYFTVHQNYPNPFNPATVITYQIAVRSFITLAVYDLKGKEVTTLLEENQDAGSYSVGWNGKLKGGEQAASGIYLYRLQVGPFAATKKMLLVR
jgi:hypothetical protein